MAETLVVKEGATVVKTALFPPTHRAIVYYAEEGDSDGAPKMPRLGFETGKLLCFGSQKTLEALTVEGDTGDAPSLPEESSAMGFGVLPQYTPLLLLESIDASLPCDVVYVEIDWLQPCFTTDAFVTVVTALREAINQGHIKNYYLVLTCPTNIGELYGGRPIADEKIRAFVTASDILLQAGIKFHVSRTLESSSVLVNWANCVRFLYDKSDDHNAMVYVDAKPIVEKEVILEAMEKLSVYSCASHLTIMKTLVSALGDVVACANTVIRNVRCVVQYDHKYRIITIDHRHPDAIWEVPFLRSRLPIYAVLTREKAEEAAEIERLSEKLEKC